MIDKKARFLKILERLRELTRDLTDEFGEFNPLLRMMFKKEMTNRGISGWDIVVKDLLALDYLGPNSDFMIDGSSESDPYYECDRLWVYKDVRDLSVRENALVIWELGDETITRMGGRFDPPDI